MVDSQHATLSVRRQGELLGLNRFSSYYQASPESAFNQHLMRLNDEQFLRTRFNGRRKMAVCLCQQGNDVNCKRVRSLMVGKKEM